MNNKQNEIIELLVNFGLTKYEIKLLIELYSKGSSKADELAEITGIRLSRTYEALDSLNKKKFISISESRPRYFTATNPQIAIGNYIEEIKTNYQTNISKITHIGVSTLEIVEPLYIKTHTDILPEELLSQFNNLKEAQDYTLELIRNAKKKILIFSHVFSWFDSVKSELIDALGRGCEIKVLMQTSLDEVNNKIAEMEKLGIHVKTAPKRGIKSRGTIVDDKAMIFVIWVNEHTADSRRIFKPHYSTNEGIVDVFDGYFNYLWVLN